MKLLITISTAALLAGCSTVPISVPVKNNHTADVKVIKQAVIPVQWQAPHQAGTLQRKLAQSIEWAQVDPNYLWFTPLNEPRRLITRGGAGHNAAAARMTRIPAGHPEGYLEGFANIYGEAALAIRALRRGESVPEEVQYPTVQDGLLGMRFIDACVRSSEAGSAWVRL